MQDWNSEKEKNSLCDGFKEVPFIFWFFVGTALVMSSPRIFFTLEGGSKLCN